VPNNNGITRPPNSNDPQQTIMESYARLLFREGLYYDKTFEPLESASNKLRLHPEAHQRAKNLATQIRLDMQGSLT
jgi:hypothetical protein